MSKDYRTGNKAYFRQLDELIASMPPVAERQAHLKTLPWLPKYEERYAGGPFDGGKCIFNPLDWTPDEVRYHRLFKNNTLDDVMTFSKDHPEGAVYHWTPEKKIWQYLGMPSKEQQNGVLQLFNSFGVKPRKRLT